MGFGGADRANDAFAHAGDDRLLRGAADQLLQIRPHRHARLHLQLDAVLRHAVERFFAQPRPGQSITLG